MNKRIIKNEHKGKIIYEVDYSNQSPEENISLLREGNKFFRTIEGNFLLLWDINNSRFNKEVVDVMYKEDQDLVNKVDKMAVVGLGGLQKIIYNTYAKISDVPLNEFKTKEEALDWLAEY